MPPSTKKKLKVLPDFRDTNGVPGFGLRRWDRQHRRYVWVGVPITDDELKTQLHTPVRLSHEPKYWLYRNRFVLQEGISSEPDEIVDLLEALIADTSLPTIKAKAQVLAPKLPGSDPDEIVEWQDKEAAAYDWPAERMIEKATKGVLPKRHSELARDRPDELILRVKHAVLAEEKALDKLRREVEAFENFERIRAAPREPIPEHVRMFVWQRDGGRCVKCGCQERLEFDHWA